MPWHAADLPGMTVIADLHSSIQFDFRFESKMAQVLSKLQRFPGKTADRTHEPIAEVEATVTYHQLPLK
jgi:hypothetical protein